MKQRFSSLDIKVIAHELSNSLQSLRVTNIYDLSTRIFLFRFAKPDHREQLVIDSGFRCHLTDFARTTAKIPSPFVAKLRKFLKTRRVTLVSQVGTDRIIEFQFSDGQYRLYFEFFAGGNIVLCDGDLKIIALLRNVAEGAEHEQLKVGVQYDLSTKQNVGGIPPIDSARIKAGLRKFIDRKQDWAATQTKKPKQRPGDSLRKALAGSINEYPPMLLEHALRVKEFDPTLEPENVIDNDELIERLISALSEAENVVQGLMSAEIINGYIIGKLKTTSTSTEHDTSGEQSSSLVMYNDFHPFKPKQFVDDPSVKILEVAGFNKTVDEFFSSIEGQKLESRLQEREENAQRKLEHARADQERRIDGLQQVKELNVRKAQAIEANLERVTEAIHAINGLIAQGMDWVEIDRLIELERTKQNPVAEIIKLPLKLYENTATLLLGEWDEDVNDEEDGYMTGSEPSDTDDEGDTSKGRNKNLTSAKNEEDNRLAVDIDLALSGWSNARQYYDQKKNAAAKEEKTLQASTKALKSAQLKIEADLKKALKQEKDILRPVRKPFWFEKFIYFISSDGYLVLGGRDAQQNEILYRRYLKKGDVYVHADLEGAVPVIIKNNHATPDAPIPPSTLSQAGNICVSSSTAWDSKAVMSAWWVSSDKVSKTHSSGEFLGVGGFAIRGDKNFLPPAQLLLGLAVLFRISDDSKARHIKHRVLGDSGNSASQTSMLKESVPEVTDDNADVTPTNQISEETEFSEGSDSGYNSPNEDEDENTEELSNPLQSTQLPHRQKPEDSLPPTTAPYPSSELADEGRDAAVDNESVHEEAGKDSNATSSSESDAEAITSTSTAHSTSQQINTAKPQPQVRGKRGKRKKLAVKYANQDEQDREEAMRLLGSTVGQARAAQEAAARKAKEEQDAANKQRRREQHLRNQEKAKALEQARMQGNGTDTLDDGETDDGMTGLDLDVFVGTPLPGDIILEAIPICAPWTALGRYKYKAKLQPGAQKKGKAVREILGKWLADGANKRNVDERAVDTEKIWPRELELIKGWKDTEIINVIPVSKVRVMMSGASASGGGGGGGGSKSGSKGNSRGGKGSKKGR